MFSNSIAPSSNYNFGTSFIPTDSAYGINNISASNFYSQYPSQFVGNNGYSFNTPMSYQFSQSFPNNFGFSNNGLGNTAGQFSGFDFFSPNQTWQGFPGNFSYLNNGYGNANSSFSGFKGFFPNQFFQGFPANFSYLNNGFANPSSSFAGFRGSFPNQLSQGFPGNFSFPNNGFGSLGGNFGGSNNDFSNTGFGGSTGFGGGSFPFNQFGGQNFGLISTLENFSEFIFECLCPGVSASDFNICVVQNEIHVRLSFGSTTDTAKTAGTRTTGASRNFGQETYLFSLPVPSFCDTAKISAKLENGCLKITCPRTAEYTKNITHVKVS